MKAAVVIPAYNEARTLRGIAQGALRYSELVIVVDDGSTDATREALASVPVVLLSHDTNRGKAAALWTGFAHALGAGVDAVVTLDGDGQHQPEDIPGLLAAARSHPQHLIVAARLRRREKYPRERRVANRIADFWLSWAAGHAIADTQSGQRVYPAALLRQVRLRHDNEASFTLESEILIVAARAGFTCVCVPIDAVYDPASRPSHFRPVRDIARIVAMVARHLLAARMNLPGLWHSLRAPPCVVDALPPSERADEPSLGVDEVPL